MGVNRKIRLCLAILSWCACAPAQVLVVHTSGAPAYAEAVEGLRAGLSKAGLRAAYVDLAQRTGAQDLEAGLSPQSSPRLIITVGAGPLKTVSARQSPVPLLPTMILHSDASRCKAACAGDVHLDVPVATLVRELRQLLPGKARVGLIRDSSVADHAAAEQLHGVLTVECDGPSELLRVFTSLKDKVDFVICLPDGSLYNTATVKPLIMASLEHRLPIVGFSSSFVQAGAAVGIYPDFREVGVQTADAAVRFFAGQTGFHESPRKVSVAVNERVIRLLGLECRAKRDTVTFK